MQPGSSRTAERGGRRALDRGGCRASLDCGLPHRWESNGCASGEPCKNEGPQGVRRPNVGVVAVAWCSATRPKWAWQAQARSAVCQGPGALLWRNSPLRGRRDIFAIWLHKTVWAILAAAWCLRAETTIPNDLSTIICAASCDAKHPATTNLQVFAGIAQTLLSPCSAALRLPTCTVDRRPQRKSKHHCG